jgi:hypothetical protein
MPNREVSNAEFPARDRLDILAVRFGTHVRSLGYRQLAGQIGDTGLCFQSSGNGGIL